MTDHDPVLRKMSDEELINGLRKIAIPMLAELQRRGFVVSVSMSSGGPPPEIDLKKDSGVGSGGA